MIKIEVENIKGDLKTEVSMGGDRDTIMTDLTMGVRKVLKEISDKFPETDFLTNVNVLKDALLYTYLMDKLGVSDDEA